MHNNAILADAAAAADRATQQQRRQRSDPREQHTQLGGACGAPATRTERELDEENRAASRADAAVRGDGSFPVSDANVAAVYAAATTIKHESIDEDFDVNDEEEEEEEEWEERGLRLRRDGV